MNKKERLVAAIENGTVIDHIPTEKTYAVANILDLRSLDTEVTIGYNYLSKKIGRKGIIKIEDKFFTDEEYGVDCQWAPIPIDYQLNHADRLPSITGSDAWSQAEWFRWIDENTGIARADCRCSLRGYIYIDQQGSLFPSDMPWYSLETDLNSLPPVRYILPIPSDAISRSNGTYVNYYGY